MAKIWEILKHFSENQKNSEISENLKKVVGKFLVSPGKFEKIREIFFRISWKILKKSGAFGANPENFKKNSEN